MLPEGWNKKLVGKLCQSIVPGRNKPKSFTGTIPWVTTPEIQGRYIPSALQVNYVSDTEIQEAGAKVIPIGSIVIVAVGDLGLVTIANERVVLNQQLHAFVCPDGFDNEYLAYYLETQKPYMESVASKTTIMYMNKSNCESIPIAYPLYPEQKKIAKILSTWDKAITTTEQLIANSQQQKKALMQQLLTGKKRLAGFSGEWEEVAVSEFGKVVTGNTPPKADKSNYGSSVCWATAPDFKGKYIKDTGVKFSKEGAKKARVLPTGSVLVTCIASIGKNAIASVEMATNQQINSVIVGDNHSNEFFFYIVGYYTRKLIAWAGTTAVPILNKSSFEKIKFLAPSKQEQQKIAQVLSSADQEIETLQQKLNLLKEEKKALMQQLLTGKRRVKLDD